MNQAADMAIINGLIVSDGASIRANLEVTDGVISYIGPRVGPAARVVDATGLVLLPGGVDTHVHLMDPGDPSREDFPHGTAAAAIAGVTTIVEHTHGAPVRTIADLDAKREHLRGRSHVDFGLAAHAWPGESDRVAELWRAGVAFFKVFTCTTHGVPGHRPADLLAHFQQTALSGAISLVHCEDESITADRESALRRAGYTDGTVLRHWRAPVAELVAVATTTLLARTSGARAVIAHVSGPDSLAYVEREARAGADVHAEACPQYLMTRDSDAERFGALRKFTPPSRARTRADELDLWAALRRGAFSHVSSDHAPSTIEQKSSEPFWEAHFGLPGLDTTFPMLLEAVAAEHLSFEDVSRLYAERPAKRYGFWPRKGRLGVGADADIAVVDPELAWTIDDDAVNSLAGWSPYSGRTVHGQVVQTYLRGELIAENRRLVSEVGGRFLAGAGDPRP